MKRWLRRLFALLLLFVWLLIMLFPVVAVLLATQNQIEVGREQGRHLRLFLLQEREQQGIGIEWSRPAAPPAVDTRCRQTRLIYLMWVGEGDNVSYCQCFDGDGSLRESHQGSCPAP
jgi:hypothetical protein